MWDDAVGAGRPANATRTGIGREGADVKVLPQTDIPLEEHHDETTQAAHRRRGRRLDRLLGAGLCRGRPLCRRGAARAALRGGARAACRLRLATRLLAMVRRPPSL